MAERIDDPALDNIDLGFASSGSPMNRRLVGLSIDALVASVITHSVLEDQVLDPGTEFPLPRALRYSCALLPPNFASNRRLFPWFQSKGSKLPRLATDPLYQLPVTVPTQLVGLL